ncbi:ataxin-10 [Alosa sapidissima]|uniref:ataxin-10 n=1 Tax=Alosa sapidissima TaxID=34773 RepID=UPI001C09B166|nr:ataxin-10 [Alosa sapidissima]
MAQPSDVMTNLVELMRDAITEEFGEKHLNSLKSLTTALRVPDFRDSVKDDVFNGLQMVLEKSFTEIKRMVEETEENSSICLQMATECFRSLRNACIQCHHNQCRLRELGFIQTTVGILSVLYKRQHRESDYLFDTLRCGIQFLGNLAVQNQNCKDDIWVHGFPQLFLGLLDIQDEKAIAYTCMALHTCLNEHKVEQLTKQPDCFKVALKVMELCRTQPELDWTILIVTEHFLKSQALIAKMHSTMSPQEWLTLLELISAHLGEGGEESEQCGILPSTAEFLASCFKDSCKAVLLLNSGSSSDDEEAIVVIRLLDILCEMTSDLKMFMSLQDYPDLLETTIVLLKEVHFLGREGGNVFSSAQNFSQMGTEGASSHPVVSFKAHLVRLIGNLCHRNIANQNKVRDLDGVALILDNCSLDSNNPFISQWAVFAIRNILENNVENQEVLQTLKRQGVADDSALRDMGFRVEDRDGSLLLRPLKKDP